MSRSVLCAVALFLTVVIAGIACGSDSDTGIASSGSTNEFGFETSIIASPDRIYTIEDVKTTGWKSSKALPTESLEGVSAVWFGFYQQKNLEVWVYESHEEAMTLGT
ncbi:MAG: hypothetical protein O6922_06435, partial [Chloroflexi bacterium]|nr:hypothetical protein [Chloroflexota bacterium]